MLLLALSTRAMAVESLDSIVEAGKDPARQAELSAKIFEWKLVGGYDDFTPLASAFVRASMAETDKEAARSLAELAVIAAPGDPGAQFQLMRVSFSSFNLGKGLIAASAWAKSLLSDPWARLSFILRLVTGLCLAGFVAALAIVLSAAPSVFPPLVHDIGDKFPRSMRGLAPAGFSVLLAGVLWYFGGLALLFVVICGVVMAYSPWRVRIVLPLVATLGLSIFPTLDAIERVTGPDGQRAWTLHRVYKGDMGKDLDQELVKYYDVTNPRTMVARAIIARREGDYKTARSLLNSASQLGGVDGVFLLSQRGGVEFSDGRTQEAAQYFLEATEVAPQDWRGWYNLAAVRLTLLDLPGAEAARAKARELAPSLMEAQQAQSAEAGGKIYPIFQNFPVTWIADAMRDIKPQADGWSSALWGRIGVPGGKVKPMHLALLFVLALIFSKLSDPGKLARRCASCGSIKCTRCQRMVKDPTICGSCWALTKETGLDSDSRMRKREEITAWARSSKTHRRYGDIVLPGWNGFVHGGGIGNLILGLFWALFAGVTISELVVAVPLGSWLGVSLYNFALALMILLYLPGLIKARHN